MSQPCIMHLHISLFRPSTSLLLPSSTIRPMISFAVLLQFIEKTAPREGLDYFSCHSWTWCLPSIWSFLQQSSESPPRNKFPRILVLIDISPTCLSSPRPCLSASRKVSAAVSGEISALNWRAHNCTWGNVYLFVKKNFKVEYTSKCRKLTHQPAELIFVSCIEQLCRVICICNLCLVRSN